MRIKVLLGSLVAVALAGIATPAAARSNFDVHVNLGAPPAAYYEVVPAPRVGWVWVPGHWSWRGHGHVWVAGHWLRSRAGYVYAPAAWYVREGRWYYNGGGWRRHDVDGDGVPNRYDRAPHNPYRY
jgi:hypothetical protein